MEEKYEDWLKMPEHNQEVKSTQPIKSWGIPKPEPIPTLEPLEIINKEKVEETIVEPEQIAEATVEDIKPILEPETPEILKAIVASPTGEKQLDILLAEPTTEKPKKEKVITNNPIKRRDLMCPDCQAKIRNLEASYQQKRRMNLKEKARATEEVKK